MDDGWMDYSSTAVSDSIRYNIRIHYPKSEAERVLKYPNLYQSTILNGTGISTKPEQEPTAVK
jgi:hypothetical protein